MRLLSLLRSPPCARRRAAGRRSSVIVRRRWHAYREPLKSGALFRTERRYFSRGVDQPHFFPRLEASRASRDGWRALGGLGRAFCGPGISERHLRPRQRRPLATAAERPGLPRAVEASRRSRASPGRHAAER